LLLLIGVNEFSEEAEFKNPCLFFKLSEVFCEYCNYCQDADLCRDELFCNDEKKWLCVCGHEYNKDLLEETLVEILEKKSIAYQLQDLKCLKCGMVKFDRIKKLCSCSGKFALGQSRTEFLTLVRTLRNLSVFHDLPFLHDMASWILSKN